jgi:hypothetical protein
MAIAIEVIYTKISGLEVVAEVLFCMQRNLGECGYRKAGGASREVRGPWWEYEPRFLFIS